MTRYYWFCLLGSVFSTDNNDSKSNNDDDDDIRIFFDVPLLLF